jgi:hypothetical protein
MKLTKEQIQDYIDGGGNRCPFCGSDNIEGGDREADGGIVSWSVLCLDCSAYWHDLYKLFDVYVE